MAESSLSTHEYRDVSVALSADRDGQEISQVGQETARQR